MVKGEKSGKSGLNQSGLSFKLRSTKDSTFHRTKLYWTRIECKSLSSYHQWISVKAFLSRRKTGTFMSDAVRLWSTGTRLKADSPRVSTSRAGNLKSTTSWSTSTDLSLISSKNSLSKTSFSHRAPMNPLTELKFMVHLTTNAASENSAISTSTSESRESATLTSENVCSIWRKGSSSIVRRGTWKTWTSEVLFTARITPRSSSATTTTLSSRKSKTKKP